MRVMVEAHSWNCVDACSEGLGADSCWDQAEAACTSSDQLLWQRPQGSRPQGSSNMLGPCRHTTTSGLPLQHHRGSCKQALSALQGTDAVQRHAEGRSGPASQAQAMLRPGQGSLRRLQSLFVAAASSSTVRVKLPARPAGQVLQPWPVADLLPLGPTSTLELQPPEQMLLTRCLHGEAGCTPGRQPELSVLAWGLLWLGPDGAKSWSLCKLLLC